MSARDLQHGCVGFGELKTSRGCKKTLKTEASKLATGNGWHLSLRVQTDSPSLTRAEEEEPHERQSHASGRGEKSPRHREMALSWETLEDRQAHGRIGGFARSRWIGTTGDKNLTLLNKGAKGMLAKPTGGFLG